MQARFSFQMQLSMMQLILTFGLAVLGMNGMVLVSMWSDLFTPSTIAKKQFVLMKEGKCHYIFENIFENVTIFFSQGGHNTIYLQRSFPIQIILYHDLYINKDPGEWN